MAKGETDISSVSSNTSINFENYNQLLDVFKETHEEANRLTLSNNRLKGLNNWLKNRIKTLEEELDNLKNDFENMKLILFLVKYLNVKVYVIITMLFFLCQGFFDK